MRKLAGDAGVTLLDIKKKIELYEKLQEDINKWSIPEDKELKATLEDIKLAIEEMLNGFVAFTENILDYFSWSEADKKKGKEDMKQIEKRLKMLENKLVQSISLYKARNKF